MSTFTITEVSGQRSWAKDGRDFIAYEVVLSDGTIAEISRITTSPEPRAGEVLEGYELKHGGKLPKLKREQDGSRISEPHKMTVEHGSGPVQAGGRDIMADPVQAAIIRQHSEHVAILFVASMQKEDLKLPGETMAEKLESLRKVVDWFDDDVRQATKSL